VYAVLDDKLKYNSIYKDTFFTAVCICIVYNINISTTKRPIGYEWDQVIVRLVYTNALDLRQTTL